MKKQNPREMMKIILAMSTALWVTAGVAMVDPTRPPDNLIPAGNILKSSRAPVLSAIYISPKRRFALINNELVKAGDKVGAYTIINIQRDTVELTDSQSTPVTLFLLPTVKQARTVQ